MKPAKCLSSCLIAAFALSAGLSAANAQTATPTTSGTTATAPAEVQNYSFCDRGGMNRRGRRRMGGLRELFDNADANNDHALTQAEVDLHLVKRFTATDKSADGMVSPAEFQAARAERAANCAMRTFERLDENQNGTLSPDELGGRFEKIVERMDRNGDGKLDANDRRRF